MNRKAHLVQVLLALMATAALPAQAVEEMIVTAEFREASLQETQISMNALSEDVIADLGISNGLDLSQYVPNLNAQPYVGGRTGISYNIRGIGNAETLITFDPAVSVYLDGVLIAKNTGALLDVMELERIEVLRGPQGTLYGRNTMGGAVNYITKKPGDEFEGSVKASFGSYEQRDFRGMLNIPLLSADSGAGALNMRISAATLNRDGIQDNYLANAPNTELGTKDREVLMAQLMWRPVDAVSVLYSYDRTRIDEEQETPWITTLNPARSVSTSLAPYLQRESNRPDGGYFNSPHRAKTHVDGHGLTITWDLSDNLALHSLTGYREMENLGLADSDGSPLNLIFTRDLQEYDAFSQEFRLIGTAMDDRLDYSAGLFYMDEEGDVFNETRVNGAPGVNIAEYANEAWAAYGQMTFAFTEKFNVTFGLRYTDEDREMYKAIVNGVFFEPIPFFDDISTNPAYAGKPCVPRPSPPGGLTCANTVFPRAHDTFSKLTPMISFGYDWTEDIMTYLKLSTGYQSGGFNSRDDQWSDFVTGFNEEDLLVYELGVKSVLANRYQINGALWYSDYDDKRVNQFNPATLASVQRNASKVEIWGIELEVLAQLTDRLQAGVNYGYVDHEYDEYVDRGVDLSYYNFPFSPKNTASAFIAYDYPLNFGVLRARLDTTYRDEMNFLVPAPELNSSSSLQLWNARVTLDEIKGPGDSIVRVSAWGKNLTDEGYWNFGVNLYGTFGFNFNTYGEPRTLGVDIEVDF